MTPDVLSFPTPGAPIAPVMDRTAHHRHLERLAKALLSGLVLLTSQKAIADIHDVAGYLQSGDGDHRTRSVAAGVSRNIWTSEDAPISRWEVYGALEYGTWYVQHQAEGKRRFFGQVGLSPALRYTFGDGDRRLFVEAGVGLFVIVPRFNTGDHRFSTAFNFGDHVGMGVRFGEAQSQEVVLRVQHFSNGGIKNPNPGINFLQLRYAYHF